MKINGFFDVDIRMQEIDEDDEPLRIINEIIEWDAFEKILKERKKGKKTKKGIGGRPAYDDLMMFKILILQKLYNLSDKQTERHLKSDLTYRRFVGLSMSDKTPDATTIWYYREEWTKEGVLEKLFSAFNEFLEEEEIIVHEGSIVDASFINRRRQDITEEEYKQIRKGEIPQWIEENEHRLRQTDLDARMGVKGEKSCNGYKLHIKVDTKSKCVVSMATTPANVSDCEMIAPLIDEKDQVVYADKGYSGDKIAQEVMKKMKGKGEIQIHEKAARDHPLSEEAKERNRQRSKVRVVVEHVFAAIKHDCGSWVIRSVGIERAHGNLLLAVLAYNIKRFCYIKAPKEPKRKRSPRRRTVRTC